MTVWLNDPSNNLGAITNPPKFFTPTRDFQQSLEDPPVAGKPLELPWIGVPQLTGLNKDVAEVFGLTNKPAVQVGEVIPDTPAAKAGPQAGRHHRHGQRPAAGARRRGQRNCPASSAARSCG